MQNGRKTNHWPRALWLGCLLAIIKLAPAVTALKMKLNKKTLGRAIRGFWVMKSTHPYYEEKECSRWISLHVCFVVVAAAILTGTFIGTLRGHCHSLAFLSLSLVYQLGCRVWGSASAWMCRAELLFPFWGGGTLKNRLLAFSFASCSHLQLKWMGFLWLLVTSMAKAKQVRARTQHCPDRTTYQGFSCDAWGTVPTAHIWKALSPQDIPTEMQRLKAPHMVFLQDKNKTNRNRLEIHLLALSFKAWWNAHSSFQLPASEQFSLRSCS